MSTPITAQTYYSPDNWFVSNHARRRMSERNISASAIDAALRFGRLAHTRGAEIHVIGRREVTRLSACDIDLKSFEGIHVVTTADHVILTVYRNRDLRGSRNKRGLRRNEPRDEDTLHRKYPKQALESYLSFNR